MQEVHHFPCTKVNIDVKLTKYEMLAVIMHFYAFAEEKFRNNCNI